MDIPQCKNLAIILPFWFYVKSILADFRRSKTAILTILEALNLYFGDFHTRKCHHFPKIQNSGLLKWSKWQFWGLQNVLDLFHVKSEWQNFFNVIDTQWSVKNMIYLLTRFYVKSVRDLKKRNCIFLCSNLESLTFSSNNFRVKVFINFTKTLLKSWLFSLQHSWKTIINHDFFRQINVFTKEVTKKNWYHGLDCWASSLRKKIKKIPWK